MNFKDKLDSLTKPMAEVSEPSGYDVEWYESVDYWNRYMWSMVRNYNYAEDESPIIKENVDALQSRIIDLSDEDELKRFRAQGSKPSYTNIGLWKIKEFLDKGDYTHIFVYGIGELDHQQAKEFKEWVDERVSEDK